jgi:hypothetical protein
MLDVLDTGGDGHADRPDLFEVSNLGNQGITICDDLPDLDSYLRGIFGEFFLGLLHTCM